MKHIFSYQRLPFTAAYFGTMMATLYAALWVIYKSSSKKDEKCPGIYF